MTKVLLSKDWSINMPVLTGVGEFLAQWKDTFSAAQSVITALAIIIGGAVAYLKLVRGRIFSKRLEPSVSGMILHSEQYLCVKITVKLANVGLTRVDIDRDSSTLELALYPANNYQSEFHNVLWDELGVVEAIQHHDWVEPGEVVVEERLLALPKQEPIAVNLRLRVLPKPPALPLWRRNEWNALAVATLGSVEATQDGVSIDQ